MLELSNTEIIDIVSSRNGEKPEPYRAMEERLGIDHASLHAMYPRLENTMTSALDLAASITTKRRLVQTILVLSLVGKVAARSIVWSIYFLYGKMLSHYTVLNILNIASDVAGELTKEHVDFSNASAILLDELFLSDRPILGFVDRYSGAIHFEEAEGKDAISWCKAIAHVKKLNMAPTSVSADGGTGLQAALEESKFVEPKKISLDLFHVIDKISRGEKVMENKAYTLIKKVYHCSKKDEDTETYEKLCAKTERAIELYDSVSRSKKGIQKSSSFFTGTCGEHYNREDLETYIENCINALAAFYTEINEHTKINDAYNYLKNNRAAIFMYKNNVENDLAEHFKEKTAMVLDYFVPLVECLDMYKRSYEDAQGQEYWSHIIIDIKNEVIGDSTHNLTEDTFSKILNSTATIMEKYRKSNSLIENINGQIRRHLNIYKSIPKSFCKLFNYYWNFKIFTRGKRTGTSPLELLTGKKLEDSWLDTLLGNFPYEKIRSTL